MNDISRNVVESRTHKGKSRSVNLKVYSNLDVPESFRHKMTEIML